MRPLSARQLEDRLHALFAQRLEDADLRDCVQALASSAHFPSLAAVWGPPLYRRNRVMFRPLILHRLGPFWWGYPRWGGRHEEALEQWLAEADRLDDVELFRFLYTWKFLATCWRPVRHWQRDLVERFRAAASSLERTHVLAKYDIGRSIDEPTALALYEADPDAARDFIGTRLHGPPGRLLEAARLAGDEQLYWLLYRGSVSGKEWLAEALAVAKRVSDPAELCAELEKRHPRMWSSSYQHLGPGFLELARRRGADVLPYILAHLGETHYGFSRWYPPLRDLALERGWGELHGALLRKCASPKEYQQAITALVADRGLPDEEVIRRLYLLTGITGDTTAARPLDEDAALAVYQRFPDLVRGPLRPLVWLSHPGPSPLLAAALAAGDETLIDHFAAGVVPFARSNPAVERLADHYALLRDRPAEFARRAASVLGRLPAYAISDYRYRELIRDNRLARLFLERSAELQLGEPGLLRDLLEAPCTHAQLLALRVLALDDDRARAAAADNLDLLLPMLLRRLHRRTRLAAFRALDRAATSEDRARLIAARAREALELPDKDYPREQLIGLIGRVVARWPALRGPHEEPLVYAREP
jgi:hypothetical protein